MTKVNSKVMFDAAKEHRFIIGAFNFRHPNGIQGVAEAARELEAVYLPELAKSELSYTGWTVQSFHDTVIELNQAAGNDCPFGIHGDHVTIKSTDESEIEAARKLLVDQIEAGWTSMAVDASHNENEDNLRITADLARVVNDAGVGLEVEIGEIGGKGGFSTPEEAEWFVSSLVEAGINPDLLAINNGSVHGNYGPGSQEGIQLDLTRRIGEAIKPWKVAIAQHGITGTPLDKIGQFTDCYITKGNVGTLWQNINFGLAMDEHGNTLFDERGHFVKLEDEGLPIDLWGEFLDYMDQKGISPGSGDIKKLNEPFRQAMLDIGREYHQRINSRAREWASAIFRAVRADGKAGICREFQRKGGYRPV